jgi:hypothetical protein
MTNSSFQKGAVVFATADVITAVFEPCREKTT